MSNRYERQVVLAVGAWIAPIIYASIAATLMSTTPVLIIPIVILTGQERVSLRAGFGAFVAIAGIAMLCLR